MVINKDISLASIAFPPLILGLNVEIRVSLAGIMGLTGARRAVNPYTTDGITSISGLAINEEGINRGTGGLIPTDINMTLQDGLLEAKLEDRGITAG